MRFKKLFGAEEKRIKKNCIILPSNDRSVFENILGSAELSRGMFFNIEDMGNCTLINLKSRWLAGDCLMYLAAQTECENIFLFGSCGSFAGAPGDGHIIKSSFNLESFSDFIRYEGNSPMPDNLAASPELLNLFESKNSDLKVSRCATVSSLHLESEKSGLLKNIGADCIDMEASMVYSAAGSRNLKALALLYTTDIIGQIEYDQDFDREYRQMINSGRNKLAERLIEYISTDV